jgi:hypothetical protein
MLFNEEEHVGEFNLGTHFHNKVKGIFNKLVDMTTIYINMTYTNHKWID